MAATRAPSPGSLVCRGRQARDTGLDRNQPLEKSENTGPASRAGDGRPGESGGTAARRRVAIVPHATRQPCREGHLTWGVTSGETTGPRRPPTPTAAPAGCLYPLNTRRARKNETPFPILNVRTGVLAPLTRSQRTGSGAFGRVVGGGEGAWSRYLSLPAPMRSSREQGAGSCHPFSLSPCHQRSP
jgi:hypothetical protein